MTRLTVTLTDQVANAITAASGGHPEQWLAKVAADRVVSNAAAGAAAYDRDHDDIAWEQERLAGLA